MTPEQRLRVRGRPVGPPPRGAIVEPDEIELEEADRFVVLSRRLKVESSVEPALVIDAALLQRVEDDVRGFSWLAGFREKLFRSNFCFFTRMANACRRVRHDSSQELGKPSTQEKPSQHRRPQRALIVAAVIEHGVNRRFQFSHFGKKPRRSFPAGVLTVDGSKNASYRFCLLWTRPLLGPALRTSMPFLNVR